MSRINENQSFNKFYFNTASDCSEKSNLSMHNSCNIVVPDFDVPLHTNLHACEHY